MAKQLWEALTTEHETNDMGETIQKEDLQVTCSKPKEKTPIQCSKCCTASVLSPALE